MILPNSAEFVREDDELGKEQRLAVMAVECSRWSLGLLACDVSARAIRVSSSLLTGS